MDKHLYKSAMTSRRLDRRFHDRTFDVGIAEQHAVTFAAGLACEGLRPFCVIYSTFLQRGYDQIIHDVALQDLPGGHARPDPSTCLTAAHIELTPVQSAIALHASGQCSVATVMSIIVLQVIAAHCKGAEQCHGHVGCSVLRASTCFADMPVVSPAAVRFAMDRAGLVGADGATHCGAFDITYMAQVMRAMAMFSTRCRRFTC